jgi:hypothetical protein
MDIIDNIGNMENIALCFTVRNCAKYLPAIFSNINRVRTLNFNIFCVFIYDNCTDNSGNIIEQYSKVNKNVVVRQIINNNDLRTVRIAKARNTCLDIVYNTLKDIKYHIMIDADDKGATTWNIDLINKYLNNFDNDNWDSISFNRRKYYDIWALLFDNFKHHCWGYKNHNICNQVVKHMSQQISNKLKNTNENSIQVTSAFNGFAIYKTDRFKGYHYDGLYSNFAKLVSDVEREKTLQTIMDNYGINVKIDQESKECCEHLFYHLNAVKDGRIIKISKFNIMSN